MIVVPQPLALSLAKTPVTQILVPLITVRAVRLPVVALSMTEQVPVNPVISKPVTQIVPLAQTRGLRNKRHSAPCPQLSAFPIIVDGAASITVKIATTEPTMNAKCKANRVDLWINRDNQVSCRAVADLDVLATDME